MWWGEEGGFKLIVKGQIMITTINPGNPYREQQAVDAHKAPRRHHWAGGCFVS